MAKQILDACDSQINDLSVTLITDTQIKKLHRQYLGKNCTTDVITFEIPALNGDPEMAEIVISLDKAASQAKKRRILLKDEVSLLLTHGILHLAGFDDKKIEDWKLMKQAEVENLAKFYV